MVSWLAKATEALRGTPPPEPEPYDVSCAQNARLPGAERPPRSRSFVASGGDQVRLRARRRPGDRTGKENRARSALTSAAVSRPLQPCSTSSDPARRPLFVRR